MSSRMFTITNSILDRILRIDWNQIDEYLSNTNDQLKEILKHRKKEQIRSIIQLTYKIKFLEMIESLWKVYRRSGLDALNIEPQSQAINRHVWPKEIQLLIQELRSLLFEDEHNRQLASTLIPSQQNSHTSVVFIDSCLCAFQNKHKEFRQRLTEEIEHLRTYNNQELRETIDIIIEVEFQQIKLEIDCHIELIYYDYKNTIYDREMEHQLAVHAQVN